MRSGQTQFLELLRSGLWKLPADASLFTDQTDWDTIVKYAKQQTVLGLVAEGINSLPSDKQPPFYVTSKIRGQLIMIMHSHAKLNSVLQEVVSTLSKQGFSPVLLKGQGIAMNYPEPTLRQCGDIDLYIGREDYERACTFVCEQYGADEDGTESEKHYHFAYKGVVVELHRIAERLPLPKYNKRFLAWSEEHLHGNQLRKVQFGEITVNLPPANFDALYIFNHAWHHFNFGGIGLRQLCDWVRTLHTFKDEINRTELEHNLKAFGLWNAWEAFGYIAVDALGLPQEEYPFYTSRCSRIGSKVLEIILQEGNFGRANPHRTSRPSGYLAGKLHSFIGTQRRFIHLLPIFPQEVIAVCARYLYLGTKQIFRDMRPTS